VRILVCVAENELQRKARYVLATLLGALGADYRFCAPEEAVGLREATMSLVLVYAPPDARMTCGVAPDVWIETVEAALEYFAGEPRGSPEPPMTFVRLQGHRVPLLFGRETVQQGFVAWLEAQDGPLRLPWDIVASSFYFLSHWQELAVSQDRMDVYGCFPYQDHLCYGLGCLDRPAVDDYLRMLELALDRASTRIGRRFRRTTAWPDDRKFAVALTHDVDWMRKFTPRYFLSLPVRPRKVWRDWRQILAYLRGGKDPYDTVQGIVALEKSYASRSTFFFLAARRHRFDGRLLGGDYPPITPRVAALCAWIEGQGWEVGLHGSYLSIDQPTYLSEEKRALERSAWVRGVRQHYLRVDVGRTLSIMEAAGFRYDTSLGFNERLGFRASFSFPYYPYCLAEDRPYSLLEIPLAIMDATLNSQGLCYEEALERCVETLQVVRASGGCCAVLWHNSIFDAAQYAGYGTLYERVLGWIVEHGGWARACRDVLTCYDGHLEV